MSERRQEGSRNELSVATARFLQFEQVIFLPENQEKRDVCREKLNRKIRDLLGWDEERTRSQWSLDWVRQDQSLGSLAQEGSMIEVALARGIRVDRATTSWQASTAREL